MDIPHDLIIDILSRLPCESLLRFRCVCKSWRSLITRDSNFRNLHRCNANNSNNNALAHWLCIHAYDWLLGGHSYQIFDKTFSSGKLRNYPKKKDEAQCPPFEDVIASCNGLICLYHRRDTGRYSTKYTFGLWNPSTRTHKSLAVLSTPECYNAIRGKVVYYYRMVGVGFSFKDSDYKVVVVARDERNSQDHHVYLYSLHDNSWSELEVAEPSDSSWRNWKTPRWFICGTYFNGACHWACEIDGKGKILCFDFDDKSIRLMDVPPIDCSDYGDRKTFVHKNMLAHWDTDLDENAEYRFWVMKEYGNSNSWTSLFRVEGQNLPSSNLQLDLFGTTIDGKCLLYNSYKGKSYGYILMAYDPETKESKELQVTNVFTLISYQENLMLL